MASRRACDGYQIWTRRARFRCGLSSGQSERPRSIRDGKLGFQFLAPLAFQNAISKKGVIAKGPLACRNVAARRLIENPIRSLFRCRLTPDEVRSLLRPDSRP